MSKDLIRRDQVHDTHMKYVIIRLDYSGVQDGVELIRAFERRFLSNYRYKQEGEMRKVSVTYSEEDLQNNGIGLSHLLSNICSCRDGLTTRNESWKKSSCRCVSWCCADGFDG